MMEACFLRASIPRLMPCSAKFFSECCVLDLHGEWKSDLNLQKRLEHSHWRHLGRFDDDHLCF